MDLNIFPIVKKEFRQIKRDKRVLTVMLFIPALMLFMFGYALNFDIKHTATAVYDEDNSSVSRDFVDQFFRSEYFDYTLTLKSKSEINDVDYEVLIDSGADLCLFHAEIAEILGIEVAKGKPKEVFGVGGKSSIYYLHKVKIEVGGWPYEIEAGFMPTVSGHIMRYGLAGQNGFFENFIVKFDLLKEEIELKQR